MKYSATDYELFTRALHQQIIEQQGYQNIEVLHNQIFYGKSGAKHQVDVCWTIKVANIEQLFCVECKLFNRRVKKEHVASFVAKIEDIGGARGVFVTTLGYQTGALRLAKHKDVTLISATYEVENRPATLEIYIPKFHDVITTFGDVSDEVAIELERMSQDVVDANQVEIYDSNGVHIGFLNDVTEGEEHHDGYNYRAIENTFIKVFGKLVEIKTISYLYERQHLGWPLQGNFEIAHANIKYIFDGKEIQAVLNSHRPPSGASW